MEINEKLIAQVRAHFGGSGIARRIDILNYAASQTGTTAADMVPILKHFAKAAGRGEFYVAEDATPVKSTTKPTPRNARALRFNNARSATEVRKAAEESAKVPQMSTGVISYKSEDCYIPDVDPTYVRWGEYKNIEAIIKSGMFFPVWIAGLSGNGKTFMVEQACAKTGTLYMRVQITPETDEDDLIGGFRLINGETVFCKGPVVKAMEDGGLLLIDEIDRGTNKIMCLQGVLEGKPILIKKTGETIFPKAGFNVIATANTKGRGSEDGRFSAAGIIDDAFLERFVSVVEQGWAPKATEKRILQNHMELFDIEDTDFADKLTSWAAIIRKTFDSEGVDEVISTRRLCHIIKSFGIFGDRLTAIKMCISRFDIDTTTAFLDLYSKVDSGELTDDEPSVNSNTGIPNDPPF